jgi:hypothetical protein
MQGIVQGDNFFKRMNNPAFWETIKSGNHNKPLNAFLAEANKVVRREFHGELTYFSVPFESVDWSPFDFVGVDLYRDVRIKDVYGKMAKGYLVHGKPVIIGEFGCCTYQGAEMLGGNGFIITFGMMAEYIPSLSLPKPISEMLKIIPKVDGHYVRDEKLQASEITVQLRELDNAGIEGAFVFTFASPTSPYNEDPRFDMDMASYSIVKSYSQEDTINQITSDTIRQGKEILGVDLTLDVLPKFAGQLGKHGETYPDMTWEPKESFKTVADYYAKN